jgi:hypothetical protein
MSKPAVATVNSAAATASADMRRRDGVATSGASTPMIVATPAAAPAARER